VVGQTSWLAHWEQKVGGQLPALPNRLRRQCDVTTLVRKLPATALVEMTHSIFLLLGLYNITRPSQQELSSRSMFSYFMILAISMCKVR